MKIFVLLLILGYGEGVGVSDNLTFDTEDSCKQFAVTLTTNYKSQSPHTWTKFMCVEQKR